MQRRKTWQTVNGEVSPSKITAVQELQNFELDMLEDIKLILD